MSCVALFLIHILTNKLQLLFCYSLHLDWGNAIIDSTIVLSLESNNTKLLYRRGLSNIRLGNAEEALVDFEHALSCQPPKDQRKLLKKKVTVCKNMLDSMKVSVGDNESNSAKKKTKKKSRDSQALAF